MKKLHAPHAYVQITTGVEGNPPRALDHAIIEVRDGGQWRRHPAMPGQYQELEVELISDLPDFTFRSHLASYTGKRPFCWRSFRGDDSVGVAQRRKGDGSIYLTECDPSKCALRQNYENPSSRTSEIQRQWTEAYPYERGLVTKNRKGETVGASCRPYNFLVVALIAPDGSYAHPRGEFAMLTTHSEVTHGRFSQKLRDLYVECGGKMTGLRLRLIWDPFTSAMGKSTPAWSLIVSDSTDFEVQRQQAAQRRMLRSLDYEALAQVDNTALVKANEPANLALYVAAEFPDVIKEVQTQMHAQQISAEYIDPATVDLVNQNPIVRRLIERCRTNYATETALPREFGSDAYRCIKWYFDYAKAKGIFIGDIIDTYGYPMETDAPEAPQASPEPQGQPEAAVVDAEFTEDVSEPSDDELQAQVRGDVVAPADGGQYPNALDEIAPKWDLQ